MTDVVIDAPHFVRYIDTHVGSPSGKAADFDSAIRRFESYPDSHLSFVGSLMKYRVWRASSPNDWCIEVVEDSWVSNDPNGPEACFDTFSDAKFWLIDQTTAWVDGFREDLRSIRRLLKSNHNSVGDKSVY